ncbi:MAG: hypothetical protein JWN04_3136 [Myxococcaceae bacterium]|nr:hypothetical protein [Myxococcaceae bacterium]
MTKLFDLDTLSERLAAHAPSLDAGLLLVETMKRGSVARGEASAIMGRPERTARTILSSLTECGQLASDRPKGPVYVRFPIASVEALFPRLFPAQLGD